VLDHPAIVAGREMLDFGSGSGLVAIAGGRAGAVRVTAAEIDAFAAAAIAANAALNDVEITVATTDLIGAPSRFWHVITAGDICYEQPMAERAIRWLRRRAAEGSLVLLGDPGRSYLPRSGLLERARYNVPTRRELEDREVREAVVWEVLPE
jgi:predicted nicotinamide N-methyase